MKDGRLSIGEAPVSQYPDGLHWVSHLKKIKVVYCISTLLPAIGGQVVEHTNTHLVTRETLSHTQTKPFLSVYTGTYPISTVSFDEAVPNSSEPVGLSGWSQMKYSIGLEQERHGTGWGNAHRSGSIVSDQLRAGFCYGRWGWWLSSVQNWKIQTLLWDFTFSPFWTNPCPVSH